MRSVESLYLGPYWLAIDVGIVFFIVRENIVIFSSENFHEKVKIRDDRPDVERSGPAVDARKFPSAMSRPKL